MAINLPASFKANIEKAHATNDRLWLLELELDRGAVGVAPIGVRLCDGFHQITCQLSDAAGPITWEPFPFVFSEVEQNQEGDLTQIELQIDNSMRSLMQYLHNGEGLEGNKANLYLVYRNGLSIAYPNHEYQALRLRVMSASATSETIALRLGLPNFFQVMSPPDRYVPSKCRWEFGGPQCGYLVNEFAGYTSCPKTVAACVARGADLVARGLWPILPGNYGGKPGITRFRA